MTTAREFGFAYARWGAETFEEGFTGPVDVDRELGGITSIPDCDYTQMVRSGVNPDGREYWEGYNEFWR